MKKFIPFSFLFFAGAFFAVLLFPSCNDTDDDFQVDFKREYFPIDSGRFWIWKVDSIKFVPLGSGFALSDTVNYYIKEVIESQFIDNAGRPTYRIERYRSNTNTLEWFISDIWFANRTDITAEKVEENLRYVKLLFPPKKGQQWKGNQFIQVSENIEWMDNWDYRLTELDQPKTFQNLTFDSTLTVLQIDNENLIEKAFATETYAKNVGLVYQEILYLEKTNVLNPWTKPENGFILRTTLIDFGKP